MAIRALNQMCIWVDEVAYRPAVVKLAEPLPRWWNCQLAHASVKLDDRWGTGHWESWGPGGPCDICGRRAAWLTIGGPIEPDEEHGPDATHLERHPIEVCLWCRLDSPWTVESRADLDRAVAEARAQTVCWRWRHPPIQ